MVPDALRTLSLALQRLSEFPAAVQSQLVGTFQKLLPINGLPSPWNIAAARQWRQICECLPDTNGVTLAPISDEGKSRGLGLIFEVARKRTIVLPASIDDLNPVAVEIIMGALGMTQLRLSETGGSCE